MTVDDLQLQWAAHSARIDELLHINQRLRLAEGLRRSRAALRWSQAGDVLEIAAALLCLSLTGRFIHDHIGEPRFWLPAASLHLWLVGTAAVAVARFVRTAALRDDAPVVAQQRHIEALQSFSLRALRVLFVGGLLVWGAPFCIVAARMAGWDLYVWPGPAALLDLLLGSGVLALLTLAISAWCATRLPRMPRMRAFARDLAGYNLKVAQQRLARLESLGQEEPRE